MFEHDIVSDNEAARSRSSIACQICRKRKIKCGRELPQCTLCKQSLQNCVYPEKALRPGPKIGSTQIPRKRKIQRRSSSELDCARDFTLTSTYCRCVWEQRSTTTSVASISVESARCCANGQSIPTFFTHCINTFRGFRTTANQYAKS